MVKNETRPEYIRKNIESSMMENGNNVYFDSSYVNKRRFVSYWCQINEIIKLDPKLVLEIGVGNKLVTNFIKSKGIDVVTMDIDKRLNPNIVGDITSLPIKSNSFDLIACFEILEHIPFSKLKKTLRELKRVTTSYVLISVPDQKKCMRIRLPFIGKLMIKYPSLKKMNGKPGGTHYWEINRRGYPLKKIKDIFEDVGFNIEDTYRLFENPYHRFFILKI